jgi:hypothetical protein
MRVILKFRMKVKNFVSGSFIVELIICCEIEFLLSEELDIFIILFIIS